MTNYHAYVQERVSGLLHRIDLRDGEVVSRCELPEAHEVIDEHEFLRLAVLGEDHLCQKCCAPYEEGA